MGRLEEHDNNIAQSGLKSNRDGVWNGTHTFNGPVVMNGKVTGAVETVTATNVITAAESGKVFFLNSATEFVSTLPAPAAGLRFRFIVKAAPSGASYTIVTNGGADIIIGGISSSDLDASSDVVSDDNADTITFADGVAVVGDWVELVSDGTSWYMSGHCKTYNGITTSTS